MYVFLLTQLHWSAGLIGHMLAGTQAVLQLGGGSLRRGRGADTVDAVCWGHKRSGGTRRRGAWRSGGWRVWDFTCRLTVPISPSSNWTGQTWTSRRYKSKWSPLKKRQEKHADLSVYQMVCVFWGDFCAHYAFKITFKTLFFNFNYIQNLPTKIEQVNGNGNYTTWSDI